MRDIDLLLVGKTGNGKSIVGNTILLRNSFISSSSPTPCTRTTSCETVEFQGRGIKVVDTPGLVDTQLNKEGSLLKVCRWATNAFSVNPSGFNALILVLKVTKRFTREEQDAITLLKYIFGENFLRDHCIIVMTCGDVFEKERKFTGLSFKQWCANQRGPFRDLLGECGNRVVLFDNFIQDKEAKEKQLSYLLNVVDRLTATSSKYTEIDFSKAKEARERILREAKLQEMSGTAMKELGLIMSLLKSIEDCEDGATRLKAIAAAHQRAETLCMSSEIWDFQPGKVTDLFKIASSVKAILWDQQQQEERTRNEGKCDEKWFTKVQLENPRQKTTSISEKTLHELVEQHEKIGFTKSQSMNQFTDLDLLLIGKSGHGKSATGNNILGRKAFRSTGSASSVTQDITYEVSDVKGRIMKVVDGPGVCDTRHDSEAAVKLVTEAMEKAIATNPKGYHAFLLVLKYGQRFNGEERDAVKFLKNIFGEDFVKDFCILVMTGGDTFEEEKEDSKISFEEWCSLQEGEFKNLLAECGNRIVLFDNMTKDASARDRSLNRLIYLVDQLRSHGRPYTDVNFEKVQEERKRLLLEAKEPLIRDEVIQATSLILQKLEIIQNIQDESDRREALEKLKERAESLHKQLSTLDNGSGVLHELFPVVKSMQSTISAEINCIIKREEDRKLHLSKLEKVKKEAAEEIEGMRKALQSVLAEKSRETAELDDLKTRRFREIEDTEKRCLQEIRTERHKLKLEAEELEKTYREIREKSDRNIMRKILSEILLPFKAVARLFSRR